MIARATLGAIGRRGRGGGHEQSHRLSLGILVKWALAQDSFCGVWLTLEMYWFL